MADGSVQFITDQTGRNEWFKLITIDARRAPSDPSGDHRYVRGRTMKVGNWLRLAGFVVLSVLPTFWVWRKPRAAGSVKKRVQEMPAT
jgi:hypothetical protein